MAVSEPAAKGFQFPYTIRMERRLTTPKWLPVATSIGALVVAFFIGGIVIWAAGGQPVSAYGHIVEAAFGSLGVFNDTMVKATPLILVGLACALAFRMKLWNIGAEGQFFLGAWGASAVVLLPILPADTPRLIMLAVMAVAGFICGALWGFIPGYLKAKLNVSEIITTLMMNYIAVSWVLYWVFGAWSEGGFQMSPQFPKSAWMPRLLEYAGMFKGFRGLTLHGGILFGIAAAFVVWFIISRSRWGYEIRLIGDNKRAAHYAGVRHREKHRAGDDGVGRPGRAGGHVRSHRRGAPPARGDLAGLRLHRHHHRLAGQAEPVRGRAGFHPFRRFDSGWS